jgi:hypothetical protein
MPKPSKADFTQSASGDVLRGQGHRCNKVAKSGPIQLPQFSHILCSYSLFQIGFG